MTVDELRGFGTRALAGSGATGFARVHRPACSSAAPTALSISKGILSARLFVAADLPGEVAASLHGWAVEAFGGDGELRVIPEEALHVTLCFIGPVGEAASAAIGEAMLGCARPARGLGVAGAAWLPAPGRARLAVVDLTDPSEALSGLQAGVRDAMVDAAGYDPETRAFRPHVTVVRVRGKTRVRGASIPPPPDLSFDASALTLYRSYTGRGGARYQPLARVAL